MDRMLFESKYIMNAISNIKKTNFRTGRNSKIKEKKYVL